MVAVNAAGFLPPAGVGGWMVLVSSRFVLVRELLKPEFATGVPAAVNAVVLRLSAWAIRSEFNHQN